MKKFLNEFKAFISKGNVMDLAVGVIIGGAFGKIVTSLVNDVIMPFVVLAVGKNSLSELSWTLRKAVVENDTVVQAALTLNWGNFLQTIIDFLIISFTVFLFVKLMMKAKSMGEKLGENAAALIKKQAHETAKQTAAAVEAEKSAPVAAPAPVAEPTLSAKDISDIKAVLTDIRDALNKQNKAE